MKSIFLFLGISMVLALGGCSKSGIAGPWSGTYINVLGVTDSFSSVTIIYTSSNVASVVCNMYQFGYVYTAFTLNNVVLNGNSASFNQDQHIIEATDLGLYNIQGNMTLANGQITLNAVATNVANKDVNTNINYQFTGAK